MDTDLATTLQHLGIAVGLGLLVGLQRERAASPLAGIRTFPLMAVLGVICATLGQSFGGWVVGLGFLSLAGLLVVGYLVTARTGAPDPGLTTEVTALLVFGLGAYLVVGHIAAALVIGGGIAILLQLKEPLHSFVRRIGDADLKAIMQFALIALVILPVLPDRTFGPLDVFNPRRVWLFVVLIVAIRLVGYVAYKLFGARVGALLGGVLGGLISSTATTLSYARISRVDPRHSGLAALVITIASAIVFGRVMVLIAVVAPQMAGAAAGPMACMFGVLLLAALVLWTTMRNHDQGMPDQSNPTELKSAIFFGGLYLVIVFAVAGAKRYLGPGAMYLVAGASGLTDMDAITLSTAELEKTGQLDTGVVWRLILVASMSNLVFKFVAAAVLGHRRLAAILGVVFGAALATGAMILAMWR